MPTRVYLGRSRRLIDEHENDRRDESSLYKNYRTLENTIKTNDSDNEGISQAYSINAHHRRKSILKGPHRTRNMNFHSTYDNLAVRRCEVSTIEFDDIEDDQKSRSHSERRDLRLCRKKIQLVNTAKQYCSNSTLHGFRYIGDVSLTMLEKMFWMITFVIAVLGAGYFIMNLYKKSIDSPIIISMDPMPIRLDEFPFPSVTICSMNKVKRTEANRINRGDDRLHKILLEDQCNLRNNTLNDDETRSADWSNVLPFMINVSQPCTDMVNVCKWYGYSTDCMEIFKTTMTDEGICCNFNSVSSEHLYYDPRAGSDLDTTPPKKSVDWNPDRGYPQSTSMDAIPRRPRGAGQSLGLTLVLDSELQEYYCSSTASVGFKILLHNPAETPNIADYGFLLSPGTETNIIIKPQVTVSGPIRKLPKKKRMCYFSQERKLEYYRTYTQKNCLLECEAKLMKLRCGCVPFYMPKSFNTSICGKKDYLCEASVRQAMVNIYNEEIAINEQNVTETLSCICWPSCSEIDYKVGMSSTKLATNVAVNDVNVTKSQEYFAENMAVVHLFFADSQYPRHVKSELSGFVDFLSSTGGLLGLFMGFSFLLLVKIVCFIRLSARCRYHERR